MNVLIYLYVNSFVFVLDRAMKFLFSVACFFLLVSSYDIEIKTHSESFFTTPTSPNPLVSQSMADKAGSAHGERGVPRTQFNGGRIDNADTRAPLDS